MQTVDLKVWELHHATIIGTCKNLSRKIPFCSKHSVFTFGLQVQETQHGYAHGDPFLFRWVLIWKIKSISMSTNHDKLTAQFYILSCKIKFPPHVTPKIRHNFRLLVSLTISPSQDMSSNKKLNFIEVVVVSTKLQVSKRSISSKSNNSPLLPESDDSRKESVVAQFL